MNNYKMIRALILVLVFCFYMPVKADMPGPAYQYDRYSENGNYFLKSIPFYNYDMTNFGKTIVYDSKSKKELYQINNYLPLQSFISNTGKSLVTITYWMWGHSDFERQKLIEIFIDGKSNIQYFIDDLVLDKTKLIQTASHSLWYDKMNVINDTLYILTFEKKVVRISLSNGKIIGDLKQYDSLNGNNIENHTEPKTINYPNIKYPKQYVFPDLISGEKFRESLISRLKKTEVKEYSECKYYIMIYGAIDKSGKCEIFMLKANVDGNENKEWKNEVKNWVTVQNYKTELIPLNCDKWVFKEYFYLK